MVAAQTRGEVQDAESDHPQRTRFPGADQPRAELVYDAAAERRAVEAAVFSRRGALGAQAAEQ